MVSKTITGMIGALWACVVLATLSSVVAQTPKVYRPGDRIPYRITFEGANAARLNRVQLHFSLITPASDDQVHPPFLQNLWLTGSTPKMVSPGVYGVTIIIPAYAPAGTFSLDMVEVTSGPFTHDYMTGLPDLTFVVGNATRPPEWPELKGIEASPGQP